MIGTVEHKELKEFGKVLKKRLWLIALCVIIACIATGGYSYFFIKPVYEASSKLVMKHSRDNGNLIKQLDINEVNLNLLLVNTYKDIIKTNAVMDRVVERYPELGLTAEQLIGRTHVSSINDTQVMTLSIRDYSMANAINTVNAIAAVFKEAVPSIMSVDNVEILSKAKIAYNVAPNPVVNIMISFILALLISTGAVFLIEYLDDSVKSEADISSILGVPTFAVVTTIRRKDLVPLRRKSTTRNMGGAPDATLNS